MSAYLALAVSVGLLAVLDTWIYVGPAAQSLIAGLVWISFIAWGAFYQSGAGTKGLTTVIAGMSFGALVGVAAVLLATNVLNGALGDAVGVSVAVGLGAFAICLASAVPLLSTIPVSVYGFASVAGPIILSGKTPQEAIVPVILSVIIGAVFGFVSEKLAGALTKKAA